jgi:alkylhydroperoxidase family enzyme
LEALRVFAMTVVEKRGWVTEPDVITFLAAGNTKAQILEVVLGITFKTLSNYTNHMADTPLDDVFESMAWAPATTRLAS